MQIVRDDHGPIFAVDYSHTPDAVTQAIKALEGLAEARGGRIWLLSARAETEITASVL